MRSRTALFAIALIIGMLSFAFVWGALAEAMPQDLSLAEVFTTGGPYYYTGAETAPAVTLRLGEDILDPMGYTVFYSSNVEPGWAKVVITGSGLEVLNAGGQPVQYFGRAEAQFEIRKAPLTVRFPPSAPEYVYNGSVQVIDCTVTGEILPGHAGAYVAYSGANVRPVRSGSYRATAGIANTNRYELSGDITFDFSIAQRPVTVALAGGSDVEFVYDGAEKPIEWTVSGELAPGDAGVQIAYDGLPEPPKYAGHYTAGVFLNNSDYRLTGEASAAVHIKPRPLRVVFSDKREFIWSGRVQRPSYKITGQVQGENPVAEVLITGANAEPINAGRYYMTVRLSDAAVNANYTIEGEDTVRFDILPSPPGGEKPVGALEAIPEETEAPKEEKDTKDPGLSSVVVTALDGEVPGLKITAKDNVLLDRIVVLNGGEPVYTKKLKGKNATEYTIVYTFVKPGSYSAVAYDAAGNKAQETAVVEIADSDGDGLADVWEVWQGTDPNKLDSDGDGIGDFMAYELGAASNGRLPAAAAMLVPVFSPAAEEAHISDAFFESGLVTDVRPAREEDAKSAPQLNGSCVILQWDADTGAGWALNGSRLMRFSSHGESFACDRVFALQGAFGVLKLVVLPGGGVMLIGHWNETAGRLEGLLTILDARAGRTAVISGSENASAFAVSGDGTRVAYCAGAKVHVLDLPGGSEAVAGYDAKALTFMGDGSLALGIEGDQAVFLSKDGKAVPEEREGLVDTVQRLNTARRVSVQSQDGAAVMELSGTLTFAGDGKSIVYKRSGGNPVLVMTAGDMESE